MAEPRVIAGDMASGLLIVVDHAGNAVPADIALGIAPAMLDEHVAIDIGAAPLAEALAARLGAAALLAGVSRLVIDLNRDEDTAALIPAASDGRPIPGNLGLDPMAREHRIARWWRPWHALVAQTIADGKPRLIVSLHSFTPRLLSNPVPRPWQIGVLYNHDARAAEIAIPLLRARHVITGDNEPYAGTVLNATMNRHAEAGGIPYLGIEVRQDLIGDAAGVALWADVLAPVVAATRDALARTPLA